MRKENDAFGLSEEPAAADDDDDDDMPELVPFEDDEADGSHCSPPQPVAPGVVVTPAVSEAVLDPDATKKRRKKKAKSRTVSGVVSPEVTPPLPESKDLAAEEPVVGGDSGTVPSVDGTTKDGASWLG